MPERCARPHPFAERRTTRSRGRADAESSVESGGGIQNFACSVRRYWCVEGIFQCSAAARDRRRRGGRVADREVMSRCPAFASTSSAARDRGKGTGRTASTALRLTHRPSLARLAAKIPVPGREARLHERRAPRGVAASEVHSHGLSTPLARPEAAAPRASRTKGLPRSALQKPTMMSPVLHRRAGRVDAGRARVLDQRTGRSRSRGGNGGQPHAGSRRTRCELQRLTPT